MKKALEFSMVMLLILLAGVFLVTSCSNPSDGRDGLNGVTLPGVPGADGGYYVNDTSIDADALELLFERAGARAVVLANASAVTIGGVIPAGKELRVATGVDVTVGSSLVVNGTLVIEGEALLIANGSSSGVLLGTAGNISGAGLISLPVILDDTSVEIDDYTVITYADVADISVAGSTVFTASGASGPTVTAIDADEVVTIFDETSLTDLRVYNLDEIVSATIPNGPGLAAGAYNNPNKTNTLVLYGDSNYLDTTATVFEPAGAVIVKGTLSTANTSGTAIVPITGGTITIDADGTLALADDNDTIPGTAGTGDIVNNGTISTEVIIPANLKAILTIPTGNGTVESTGAAVLTLDTDTVTLSQNLLISAGSVTASTPTSTDPVFGGGKTITVEAPGVLIFPATVNITTNAIGAAIEYDEDAPGTVRTLTTSSERLADFFALGGNIDAGGAVALAAAFEVPAGVTLTSSGNGTYAGAFAVEVKGTATFGAATTFGSVTTFTVSSTGVATINATALTMTGDIVINGEATFLNAVSTPANVTVGTGATGRFAGLTAVTALTINGTATVTGTITFPAAATIAGDLTVGTTLAGGTSLDFDVTGTVTLTSLGTTTTGTGKIKTSGNGAIKVLVLNDISFKLVGTGVDVVDLDDEITSLATDLAKGTAVNLDAAFRKAGTIGVSALGSLTAPDASAATAVTDGAAGTGTSIALAAGTTATGGTIKLDKYSKAVINVAQITLAQDSTNLKVTDAGWGTSSNDTFVILAVEDLQLSRVTASNGIQVIVPTFNIGLKTKRT